MICGRSLRFVYTVKLYAAILSGNRLRFVCGNDAVAVAMHFAMKNGQIRFSLRKFLAISLAIQKIASDCGCDAVVHLGVATLTLSAGGLCPLPSTSGPPGNGDSVCLVFVCAFATILYQAAVWFRVDPLSNVQD